MCDKTRINYFEQGIVSLPASSSFTLFRTTDMFDPKTAVHNRCFWFDVALTLTAAASLQLMISHDGGDTWTNAGSSVAVAVGTTVTPFFVSPYLDWLVLFTNGAGVNNGTVDMVIDHTSRATP